MKHKPLILYADDNLNIVEAWKTLLTQKGYEVLTATDGREAVEAFVSQPVDLVLLDYHMPRMNGDVAADRMKACKTDVPIALLSADDVMPMRSRDAVDVFVSKSESIPRVLEIVENLLSRRVLFRSLEGWVGEGEKAA
jgi:CheY-like chemotaxis protein